MKKIYFSIFTAALLLTSFLSFGQTFNSLNANVGPFTYDDGRFWQGGIPPPNPCTGCTINIHSSVAMVQATGGSTASSRNIFSYQTPAGGLLHGAPITVGMRFQSSTPGFISQASFYKVAGMGGTHTAVLYDNTGVTVLATVTFTGETASGWQFQDFPAPVAIIPGISYVIAVYFDDGNYYADNNYFAATGYSNAPLSAPQDGTPDPNGVFTYGGAPTFPSSTYLSSNYWVDVSFSVTGVAPYTNVFGAGTTATPPSLGPFTGPPITLGMNFRSLLPGNILGVKFYKVPGMTGTHTGVLYDNTGTVLATVVFSSETASGWQTQNFVTPVAIAANVTYTSAVYYADGNYTSTRNFFTTSLTNDVLTAVSDGGPLGPNGVYANGAAFPTTANNASNYWVDVSYFSAYDGALNDMVFNNSTIKLVNNLTLTVNTYVELQNNTQFIIASSPSNSAVLNLNDQMDLSDASSGIQLGNGNSYINTTNLLNNPIIGPHDDFLNPGFPIAGIYSILGAPVGGASYSYVLTGEAIGFNLGSPNQQPNYGYLPLNCGGAGGCGFGFVSGPATTGPDPMGNLGIIFNSSAILPVQLVQFLASKKADGSVLLTWATSQEVNAGYFDVERSTDQSGWLKLGSVKAKGNSSTTTNYNFSDGLPLDGNGYYRLKMVDLDGKFKYSKTVSVSNSTDQRPLVIYSNPFSDMIRLKVNVSRAEVLNMTVSDLLGKTYISQTYHASSGDNLVNLPSSISSQGMYILRIHGESYDQTVKLEKQ